MVTMTKMRLTVPNRPRVHLEFVLEILPRRIPSIAVRIQRRGFGTPAAAARERFAAFGAVGFDIGLFGEALVGYCCGGLVRSAIPVFGSTKMAQGRVVYNAAAR